MSATGQDVAAEQVDANTLLWALCGFSRKNPQALPLAHGFHHILLTTCSGS